MPLKVNGRWRKFPFLPHPERQNIRGRRKRYGCAHGGRGCYPAYLASLYDQVPFEYFLTLTAESPEKLDEYLKAWTPRWEELGDPRRPERQPVWIRVVASDNPVPTPQRDPRQGLHVHIVVGNLPYQDLFASLSSWKGGRFIERIWNKWGILHYILTQDVETLPSGQTIKHHAQDVDNYCHAIYDLRQSDNLALYEIWILAQRQAERAERNRENIDKRWERERQRGAA